MIFFALLCSLFTYIICQSSNNTENGCVDNTIVRNEQSFEFQGDKVDLAWTIDCQAQTIEFNFTSIL